ncbi:MAG: hypothetical protein AAF628_30715 [Planctomycetota bacterium]
MQKLLLPAALLVIAVPVAAQGDHFTTSPEGYDFLEGNSHSDDLIGTQPLLRYQQIDSTNTRSMSNRNRLAFRRDAHVLSSTEYGARNIEVEVVMAESDLDAISTTFDSNYTANSMTVMNRVTVAFEDYTLPQGFAATATNTLFFDQIWSYNGSGGGTDLLWELKVYSNDQAGTRYPMDFEFVTRNGKFGTPIPTSAAAFRNVISTGCATTFGNAGLAPEIKNYGTFLELSNTVFNGVASAPVTLIIDSQDRALTSSAFCTTLHALVGAAIPAGTADATGRATFGPLVLPHDPGLIGQTLVFQGFQPCVGCFPGQADVSATRAVELTVQPDPDKPKIGRVWSYDPTATDAVEGPHPGGLVIWTNHT